MTDDTKRGNPTDVPFRGSAGRGHLVLGVCILCQRRTQQGRIIAPRKGMARTFVCLGCRPCG